MSDTIAARATIEWLIEKYNLLDLCLTDDCKFKAGGGDYGPDVTIKHVSIYLFDTHARLVEAYAPISIKGYNIPYSDPEFHAKVAEVIDKSINTPPS